MKQFIFIGFFVLFIKPVLAQNGFQLDLDFLNLHQLAYYANSVPHPTGGIVIIHSPGAFSGDMGVVITYIHSSGEIIWSKNIKTPMHQMIQTEISFTPEGNIVFPIAGGIVCLNSKGEILWAKQIKENINWGFWVGGHANIHTTSKGEIVSVGNKYNSAATGCSGALLRLDANGSLISSKTIKTFCDTRSAITSDDQILITEQNKILKLDLNGNIIWAKEISPSGNTGNTEFAGKAIEDRDGNIVFLNRINNKWIMVKLNGLNGEIIWVGDALSAERLEYRDIAISPEGEYIAAGRMYVTGYTENLKFISTVLDSSGRHVETRAYENISNRSPEISVEGNEIYLVSVGSVLKTGRGLKTSCSFQVMPDKEEIKISVADASVSLADESNTVADSSLNIIESPVDAKVTCCDSPTVTIKDSILCPKDTIFLSTTGATGHYHWSTGDTTPTIKVHKAGKYWVTVSNVCGEASDTIVITKGTLPQPNFTISPTETEPDKFVNFSDNSQNVQQRLWHTGDGFTTDTANFSHTYSQNGTYPAKLELTSPTGCTWDTTVIITISYHSWFLPNAFTPNNDGLNEVFEVKGYGIRHYELQVYNRWGERVFDGTNQGWNGFYKDKQVQPGLYKYRLYLQYDNYRVVNHSGDVYVVE